MDRPRSSARWQLFLETLNRPWSRLLLLAWAALGSWDLFVSQFIPERIARKFPKAYQVIEMTTGWLSWQQWLFVGLFLVAFLSSEYAFRLKRKFGLPGEPIAGSNSGFNEQTLSLEFGEDNAFASIPKHNL